MNAKFIEITVNSMAVLINTAFIETVLRGKDGKAIICTNKLVSLQDNDLDDFIVDDMLFTEESFSEINNMLL